MLDLSRRTPAVKTDIQLLEEYQEERGRCLAAKLSKDECGEYLLQLA
jgi:hypothetical protein